VPCSRLLLALLVILALLTVGPLANADADDAAPGWQGADLDGVEHNAGMACEGVRISIPEPTPGSLLVLPGRPCPVGGPSAMPTGPRAPPVRSSTLTRSCTLKYCVLNARFARCNTPTRCCPPV